MDFKKIPSTVSRWYKLTGLYLLKFVKKHYIILAMALVTVVAVVARYMFVMYPTNDLAGFIINGWMGQIDELGFDKFYLVYSDYPPIFLFFLAFLCMLPEGELTTQYSGGYGYTFYANRMVYLKTLFLIFTIALAFGVFLLVKELTKSDNKALVGYIATLVLPTIFVNSSVWGNADVIYAVFLIFSFYFALKDSSSLSFVFFGLSFANKLQAIFILPFLIYLVVSRKLKLWPIVFAPLVYFITFIPAFIYGATVSEAFKYFEMQLSGQPGLTYNAGTIWKFLELNDSEIVVKNAMWFAILAIGALLAVLFLRNVDLKKKENVFKVGFMLTMATIFFLPRMHERYYFIIEVLIVVYALIDKKWIYLVPLMQLSTMICYYPYLTGYYIISSLGGGTITIAAIINLFILCVSVYDVLKIERTPLERSVLEIENEINELKNDKRSIEE